MPGPLPVGEQPESPIRVFSGLQDVSQPEQVVLLREQAGAGVPEADLLCAEAVLAALFSQQIYHKSAENGMGNSR